MKKILHFTGSFHQGGSERQALQLASLLKADGEFEIFLAALDRSGNLLDEAVRNGFTDIGEYKLNSFYDRNFIRQLFKCRDFIRRNNIDIVHTHDFYTNVFGIAAAKLAGVKIKIASKRETDGMRSDAQKFLERQIFRLADKITVNAAAVEYYLVVTHGISREKSQIIYNGLDLARLTPANSDRQRILPSLNLPHNKRFVAHVANFRHGVKNQQMLIRAAPKILEKVPDAAFVFAGEGALAEEVKKFAAELKVAENCYFIGRCTDTAALLAVCEIGILTSIHEGFSNSILEYMAAKLPVVATDVGGAVEAVFDGKTGFLVESDDDTALAEKLILLLENRQTAINFGLEGRKRVENLFSTETQLRNTKRFYNKLLNSIK